MWTLTLYRRHVTCSTWSRFLHLVPLYLTSFPAFFSVSVRTSTSLSDSIQTSFLGRSISNVTPESSKNKEALCLIPRSNSTGDSVQCGYTRSAMDCMRTRFTIRCSNSNVGYMLYFWCKEICSQIYHHGLMRSESERGSEGSCVVNSSDCETSMN